MGRPMLPPRDPSSALQLLLDCLGEADTVALIEALRGTRWNIPASGKLADGHALVEFLGREKADKLGAYLAGETGFRIPVDQGVVDRLIHEAHASGITQNQIALRFKKDVRTVQLAIKRHKAKLDSQRQAEAQMGLFGIEP